MITKNLLSYRISPGELSRTKQRLLNWASQHQYCAYFDNCEREIDRYGQYELLIGVKKNRFTGVVTEMTQVSRVSSSWLMGIFPYELKNILEPRLKSQRTPPVRFPELALFVPDTVIYLRRGSDRLVIEGEGHEVEYLLNSPEADSPANGRKTEAPQFVSSVGRDEYLATIHRLRQHIRDGDFYEINLSQSFQADYMVNNPAHLFQRLTAISPVPFASFIRFEDKYLLCASPERFLQLRGGRLLSQPMKGTAPREEDPVKDRLNAHNLRHSLKEQAENVMIVDLTRNDLYRSSIPDGVAVPHLFEIQQFPQVHQMVSTITAQIRPDISWQEAFANTFPPGSMTGAPKVKTMEMIDHYEATARGIYAGSAGYITPGGEFDLNVIIRSMIYDDTRKKLVYHVGGAITYDSDPEMEYEETLVKARGIRKIWGEEY